MGSHRGTVRLCQLRGPRQRQALQGVEVQPLVQGHELPSDGLGRIARGQVASGVFPLTAPQPCCRTRRPQAGSKCPLVATKRHRTAMASGTPPRSPSAPPGPPAPRRRRPRGTGPPRSRWRRRARCPHPGDPAVLPGSAPAPAPARHPPAGRGERAAPGRVVGFGRAGQEQDRDLPVPWAAAGGPAPCGKREGPGRRRAGCGCVADPRDFPPGFWAPPVPGTGASASRAEHQGLGECFPRAWHGTAWHSSTPAQAAAPWGQEGLT